MEESKEPPAAYLYEYVGDEVVEQWEASGKETVQNAANEADECVAITLLDELARSALDGRLDPSEAGLVVRNMIAHHQEQQTLDVTDLLLNIVSVINLADYGNPKLLTLLAATNIDPEIIRREFDVDLLRNLPLVRSSFLQMRTRKTTNILYRQANFNLLREESEGYAKLITEYFNTANEAVNNHDVSAEDAFQRVMALVGSFDLDVGRVLDITLDISANLLVRAYPFFVRFYRCSSWWPADGLFDDIEYEDAGLNTFPTWLLPGACKGMTDDEVDEIKEEEKRRNQPMKDERDAQFWQDASERGMQPFNELGARKIKDFDSVLPILEAPHRKEYGAKDKEVNVDRRKRIEEDRKYMRTTGFLPPPGNADAAQLLGFKLSFYGSTFREAADTLPSNLVYFAALLIKIGFISLRDLYPHLYPKDEDMPAEKTRLEKEKAERDAKDRPGAGMNALAMAGALPDDTVPAVRGLRAAKEASGASTPKQSSQQDEEPNTELPQAENQKLLLLKTLLAIGALPEALYILGRFPWLVDVDAEVPMHLHRIAKKMLSKVADSVKPLSDRSDLRETKTYPADKTAQPDGTLPRSSTARPKGVRWLKLEQLDPTTGQQHRHYYPDWDDKIPVCQTVDDVFALCDTFMGFLGVKVGQDAELLGTLIRIAKSSLTDDFSDPNRSRWLDLMRRVLVPALSLSKHNTGLTEAVYELLKFFPTTTRYDIYAEWFQGRTSRLPDMRAAFDYNRAEVKDVLRRVTNESGKRQARALSKVSLSSPGIVAMSMINQLESYSNMIPSLVECVRYFSFLAYDVLTWCLINSLGGQGRDRLQGDGMLTSPWLQALSNFAASLFKSYSIINPSPVLQYLAFELRSGNTTDLELLEQVLNEMAGIRSDIDFNDAQILAMAGGEQLRAITVQQLHDKRHAKKDKAVRLMKALSDPGLTGPMLIAIAQERQIYSNHKSSENMPLKVLGSNLDKIMKIFMQYLEALKTSLKPEEFRTKIPDVIALIGEFGLEPGIAFTIYRTVILHLIAEHDAFKQLEAEGQKRTLSQEQSSRVDVAMKEDGIDTSKISEAIEEEEASEGNAESPKPNGQLKRLATPHSYGAVAVNGDKSPWHPVLESLIQGIPAIAPELPDRISIPFFVTFWTLSLQDILVHPASYDVEIKRLRAQASELTPSNRSSVPALTLKENERKKQGLAALQEKLSDELKGRIGTYQKTRNRLSKSEKDHWFDRSMKKADLDARHVGLLQECFLPRAMLSSLDAHYCFLMLKMLHDNGTPGFSTMILLSQLFRKQQLAAIIFQCTELEAAYFGRFMCEILRLLQHWHGDKAAYEKEAFGAGKQERLLPGFAKKLDVDGKPETHMEFEDFRRLLYNWHTYLNNALIACFESNEFMHIRNGIIVLQKISPVFPAISFMGSKLVEQVTKVSVEDAREDLRLNAQSLLGQFKHREKSWMLPQAFRLNEASKEGGKAGSRQPSARPETPQPEKGTPKLSAAAPEFKPSLTNGMARKESVAGPEDGEVEDEKLAVAKDGDVEMKDEAFVKTEVKQEGGKTERSASTAPSRETPQPPSRAETPAGVPSKPLPADAGRPRSSQAPPRAGYGLPDRPERAEMRPPGKPLPAPHSDRGSGRYSGRAEERFGRLDRPGEARPASRDHSPSRSRPRTPERDGYYGSRGPPREHPRGASDSRYPRDDAWSTSRREPLPPAGGPGRPSPYDSRSRVNGTMGPPSSQDRRGERDAAPSSAAHSTPTASSRPPPSGQPAQGSQPSTSYSENPARLALINKEDSRHERESGRGTPQDSRRERDLRDERRPVPSEVQRESSTRAEQATENAPNGPRRGRSTRDLGPQVAPETSYGRLNGPSEQLSAPARAPDGPSGRGGRAVSSQQPPSSSASRPSEPPLPSSSSAPRPAEPLPPPRGPGARMPQQHDRRNSGPQFERQPSSTSVPTTPASESGPSVHPDRLRNVGGPPPPIQTNLATNGPRSAASPSTATPTGPRGGSSAPSRAPLGPSSAAPPTGPQSRRSGGQLADINATLQGSQGANGQGVNFRGAALNRAAPALAASAQTVQSVASAMEPPPRRSEAGSGRRDGRAEPSRDLLERTQESAATAAAGSRGGSSRAPPPPAEQEDRHRNSRQPSRDRHVVDVPPLERPLPPGMGMEDGRRGERRGRDEPRDSGRGAPRADDRPPHRPPPPGEPPNASFGGGPPPEWPGRQSDRRGPPGEERRGGGGRGGNTMRPDHHQDYNSRAGGGGRREDERRGGGGGPMQPPPRDEGPGGRKRRHEDVSEPGGPSEGDKRRRASGR